MKLSSNVIADSHDENNFPHKLLLNNTHVSRLRKAFANNSSAKQSGGFLGRLLGPLLKNFPFMKNVRKKFAKSVLGLTAASSATDAVIYAWIWCYNINNSK